MVGILAVTMPFQGVLLTFTKVMEQANPMAKEALWATELFLVLQDLQIFPVLLQPQMVGRSIIILVVHRFMVC